MAMQTGETGLNLIKAYEGLRMTAHYTPSQEWTVGYGHRSSARHGMSVTEGDAIRLLQEDVKSFETIIEENVRAPLNQNEHDALISLLFNIGEGNFKRSTVLRKLNAGDKLGAAEAFEKWTKAKVNGELVTLDGLVRRRAAEKSLFLMPTDASLVVPSSEVEPAPECDGALVSEEELKSTPLVDFDEFRDRKNQQLSEEESNLRLRALYAATQSLSGDPTKMIISKAEEREDLGVTIGAALAGLLALSLTLMGGGLMFGLQWPSLAETIGISEEVLLVILENLPVWLAAIGAAMCYFILYVLVKRAARHDLKKQRAREIARVKSAS
ncbi:MAG: lysozyme [Aquisalinus sp.]|nr:lysozyme [Aquisalinus sp.]